MFGAIVAVIETIPGIHKEHDTVFSSIEVFFVVNFTLEFLARLCCCPDFHAFGTNFMNWIDVASIAPFYVELVLADSGINLQVLRILRTARALRMVKVGRYSSGIRLIQNSLAASMDALQLFAGIFAVLVIVLASAIYYTERGDYDKAASLYERKHSVTEVKDVSPFQSIPGCFWWTIVTLTTVGYGDMQPVTPAGYAVGIITMLTGVIVLALPLSIIGANFHEERLRMQKERADKLEAEIQDEVGRGGMEALEGVTDQMDRYLKDFELLVVQTSEVLKACVDLTTNERCALPPHVLIGASGYGKECTDSASRLELPPLSDADSSVVDAALSRPAAPRPWHISAVSSDREAGDGYLRVTSEVVDSMQGKMKVMLSRFQSMHKEVS